jgi:FkbM family methyltransferase
VVIVKMAKSPIYYYDRIYRVVFKNKILVNFDMKKIIIHILNLIVGKKQTQQLYNSILFKKTLFSESDLIYDYLRNNGTIRNNGTMIDVGAHFGESFEPYLDKGWRVLAFEPDKTKWESLNKFKRDSNLTLFTDAVSNKKCVNVPFYVSAESTGISSLSPFVESHKEIGKVNIVTLRDVLYSHKIENVDYLKIDTEGHDLFVLQGFPWDIIAPDIILCEFEDLKTKSLGYDYNDLGQFLIQKGYSVYLSEWYPIVKYGAHHKWRRLVKYPANLEDFNGWGNFIAVLSEEAKVFFERHITGVN